MALGCGAGSNGSCESSRNELVGTTPPVRQGWLLSTRRFAQTACLNRQTCYKELQHAHQRAPYSLALSLIRCDDLHPSSSIRASLPRLLPTELKALIARHVHDSLDDLMDFGPKTETTIFSLSVVSHEWRDICEPLIWRSVEAAERTNESLLELITKALPRYARHVKAISLRQPTLDEDWASDSEGEDDEEVGSPPFLKRTTARRRHRVYAAAKKAARLTKKEAKRCDDPESARDLLHVAFFNLLPNLQELDWECDVDELNEFLPSGNLFFDRLSVGAGPSLSRLSIGGIPPVPLQQILSFVSACPNINSLSVTGLSPIDGDQWSEFLEETASLPKLTMLALGGSAPPFDDLFSLTFTAPLRELHLLDTDPNSELAIASFDKFRQFCTNSSASLQYLNLAIPMEGTLDKVLPLPQLTRLHLLSPFPYDLTPFSASPLRTLDLATSEVTPEHPSLVRSLEPFCRTLRSLTIGGEARQDPALVALAREGIVGGFADVLTGFSDREVEEVKEWGSLNGVEVEVEEAATGRDEDGAEEGGRGLNWLMGDSDETSEDDS